MNIRNNPILRQKLAAEYVLGTLRGGARRRFEAWLYQDADLRNLCAAWQQRLAPMAEFAGDVAPPKRVWTAIDRRLRLTTTPAGRIAQFWRQDHLAFWRSLGMVSTALTAMLLVVVLSNRAPNAVAYVAALADDQTHTTMLVTADSSRRDMEIRMVSNLHVEAGKSLHLWAVPKSGHPRSLGLITAGRTVLPLPASAVGDDVAVLAVSLEPPGGSPDPNGPTGPVIYKGAWVRL
ncbi:anti-sigma factor [Massilia sp. DWR3-1-1]|uniref:anti-sigma factor n=1 Tax=Massilia sp. DWR3-1-1 TaxID=2804559 RepID=UPI003CF6DFF4